MSAWTWHCRGCSKFATLFLFGAVADYDVVSQEHLAIYAAFAMPMAFMDLERCFDADLSH